MELRMEIYQPKYNGPADLWSCIGFLFVNGRRRFAWRITRAEDAHAAWYGVGLELQRRAAEIEYPGHDSVTCTALSRPGVYRSSVSR